MNVGRVHLDLPFGGRSLNVGMLKTEGHELFDEGIHKGMAIQFKDLFGQRRDAIEDRTPVLILRDRFFQQTEDLPDKIIDISDRSLPSTPFPGSD